MLPGAQCGSSLPSNSAGGQETIVTETIQRVVCEKGAATSQGQSSPDCVTVMVDVCFSLLHAIIKKLDHS